MRTSLLSLLVALVVLITPSVALSANPAPTGLHVQSVTSTSVTVAWNEYTAAAETGYTVQVRIDPAQPPLQEKIVPTGTLQVTFSGLSPSTTYWFRIKANGVNGAWSAHISEMTLALDPTATPTPTPTPTPSPTPTPTPTATPTPSPTPTPTPSPTVTPTPTPTPPPTTATWTCGWGLFDSDSLSFPGSCWRPYADAAWVNTRVDGTPILSNSAAMVARVLNGVNEMGGMTVGSEGTDDYNHPLTAPDADDPTYTIHCWRYACPSIEGKTIRLPVNAKPAQGTDRHLAVLMQPEGYVYDLYKMETDGPSGGSVTNWSKFRDPAGGTLYIGSGGRTAISGDGRGEGGDGAVASKTGLLAGPIRAEEMRAGVIPHALFQVVGCVKSGHVYPSQGDAKTCTDQTNAPSTGQYFRLNLTDAQIAALPGPDWRKVIWTAMAHYGTFVADTGGAGTRWNVQPLSDRTYTDYGARGAWAQWASEHVGDGYVTARTTPEQYRLNMQLNTGIDFSTQMVAIERCAIDPAC